MQRRSRTFRLFVSSTFSDMKAERDALARDVFPRAKNLCESRGYRFQPVDLRWGVREESSLDQLTVRICLDEINRCQRLSPRPNFIVLLGDRYGWRPLPGEIPAAEMERMLVVSDTDGHGRISKWYRRDENAVPAEYVLQPRRGALAAYAEPAMWEMEERLLLDALVSAAGSAGVTAEGARKYGASATELEILKGALEPGDSHEHVFAFYRSISNLDEMRSSLSARVMGRACDFLDTDADGNWDQNAWRAQRALREELTSRIGEGNVWTYGARWNGEDIEAEAWLPEIPPWPAVPPPPIPVPGLERLCQEAWIRLANLLGAEMDRLDAEATDRDAEEQDDHAEFAHERANGFVGRAAALARIRDHLRAGLDRPLVVVGPAGSGKSSLLARASAAASAAHPDALIVRRFIGITPASSGIRSLLQGLCRELAAAAGQEPNALPNDFNRLVRALPSLLSAAAAVRPVFMFLDALDQLDESYGGRELAWLPSSIDPAVRIVVSTLPDREYGCLPRLLARSGPETVLQLEPMSLAEGEQTVSGWLASLPNPRRLTPGQLDSLRSVAGGNGVPLYLKLLFERARKWRSYDQVAPESLPVDSRQAIQELFASLSSGHGKILVRIALGYLATARYGLSDSEMLELLWADADVRGDFNRGKRHALPAGEEALPPILWSRLYAELEPYLSRRDAEGVAVHAFYHRQIAQIAEAEFVPDAAAKSDLHRKLAAYFATRWRNPDGHALAELVWQCLKGGNPGMAARLCREADFLNLRYRTSGVLPLETDAMATAEALVQPGASGEFGPEAAGIAFEVAKAIRQESHWLAKGWNGNDTALPVSLPDLLWNRLLSNTGRSPTEFLAGIAPRLGLAHAVSTSLSERVLNGHEGSVNACAFSPDGGSILSASDDCTLRIWDSATGTELGILRGHGKWVHACAFSPDGRICFSASNDHRLLAWNPISGIKTGDFSEPDADLEVFAFSRNGGFAISVPPEGPAYAWELATGIRHAQNTHYWVTPPGIACAISDDGCQFAIARREPGTNSSWRLNGYKRSQTKSPERNGLDLESHRRFSALAFSPDGVSLAIGYASSEVEFRRFADGEIIRTLTGHGGMIKSCAFSPDGMIFLTASEDRSLRVWSTVTGTLLKEFHGHDQAVNSAAFDASGSRIVSAGADGTLRLWSVASEGKKQSIPGHAASITACALTADGRFAISGSKDHTLKVWDTETGKESAAFTGHSHPVTGCAVSRNGKVVLSSSIGQDSIQWDRVTGAELIKSEGPRSILKSCGFAPDGGHFVTGGLGLLKIWGGKPAGFESDRPILEGHDGDINACLFTPDGTRILSASDDGTLRLWDFSTGRELLILRGHTDPVTSCGIYPNGRYAISGSVDKSLRIWSLETGAEVLRLAGHPGEVTGCAFSTDGRYAVSSSTDATLRVWELTTGACIHVVGGECAFNALAMASDTMIAGDANGNLWIWRLGLGTLLPVPDSAQ